MLPAAPHLLTLPREIRDTIYSYLTQCTEWKWSFNYNGELPGESRTKVTKIKVHNAPLLSVLLVHSRLNEEYFEACFKNLAATTSGNIKTLTLLVKKMQQLRYLSLTKALAAIAYVRYVTIFIDLEIDFDAIQGWVEIRYIVALQYRSTGDMFYHHTHFPLRTPIRLPKFISGSFLPSPSESLAGLPLIQRGEGYRLESNGVSLLTSNGAYINGFHMVKTAGYLYSKDKSDKHLWRPEQITEQWPINGCDQYCLHFCTTSERARLNRLRYDMAEWREKYGEEARAWNWVRPSD